MRRAGCDGLPGGTTVLALAVVVLSGCGPHTVEVDEAYSAEIESWRASREERLRSDTGWLTLVGLHWLEEGVNPFGSGPENPILLPEGRAPADAGVFLLRQNRVTVRAREGAGLTLNGRPVAEQELRSDAGGAPDILRLGELRIHVIERAGRFGIRVKDPASPVRAEFRGLDHFPLSPEHRVTGRFVPYEPPKSVEIPTAAGTVETVTVPGFVEFSLGGRTHRLDPVADNLDEPLFFIFKDLTSGRETYGAGRFLYADPPVDGVVVLDFNKAYNPPCVFTPYATCPLPPKQNRLDIRVEAGEKVYGEH